MKNHSDSVKAGFKKRVLVSAILLALPTINSVNAQQSPGYNAQRSQQAALDKYFIEEYNFCDSKVLAKFWGGGGTQETKVRFGQTMLARGPQEGARIIDNARTRALSSGTGLPCSYEDGGFTYSDAESLAGYWGTKDVLEAKTKMGVLMVQGDEDLIRQALAGADQITKRQGTSPAGSLLLKTKTINADKSGVTSVAFTSDGKRIVSGGWENRVKLWDVKTGRLYSSIDLKGKGDLINDLAVSPDGKYLVTANRDYDKRTHTVQMFNLRTRREAFSLNRRPPDSCNDIAFSPNGKQFAATCFDAGSGDATLQVWNTSNGRAAFTIQDVGSPILFTANGEGLTAAYTDGSGLRVWSTSTEEALGDIKGFPFSSTDFNWDSSMLLTGGFKGELKSWNTVTNQAIVTYNGHTATVNGALYSPDGKYIASASKDKTLRLWEAASGKQLAVYRNAGEIESLAFSPDGRRLVIGGTGGKVTLFSVNLPNTTRVTPATRPPRAVPSTSTSSRAPTSVTPAQTPRRVTPQSPPAAPTRASTPTTAPPVSSQPIPQASPQPTPQPINPALVNYSHRVMFFGSLDGETTYVTKNDEVVLIAAYNNDDVGVVGYKQPSGDPQFKWQIESLDGEIWSVDGNNNLWALDQYGNFEAIGVIEAIQH